MELKTNKEKRFDEIYKAYSNEVYRICFSLAKNENDAKELMQKVLNKKENNHG